MNGISGVSFQEVPGGLRVRVKKSSKGSSKGSSSGKLRKRLPYNFKQISRQITRADLKYLKALFDRLEQEKKQASSGVSSISSSDTSNVSFSVDCLPEVETTDIDIGECFDAMV